MGLHDLSERYIKTCILHVLYVYNVHQCFWKYVVCYYLITSFIEHNYIPVLIMEPIQA